jgi:hypothetical protein
MRGRVARRHAIRAPGSVGEGEVAVSHRGNVDRALTLDEPDHLRHRKSGGIIMKISTTGERVIDPAFLRPLSRISAMTRASC